MGEQQEERLTDLLIVHAAEEHNFGESLRVLGEAASLTDDLSGLYDRLAVFIGPGNADLSQEKGAARLLALHFLGACRYHLTMSTLDIFRGHLNDSLTHLRSAIEFAAFAAHVRKHPHKGDGLALRERR